MTLDTLDEVIAMEQTNSNISQILDIIYDYLDILDSVEEESDNNVKP